jgi:acetyl esterase/lipase
MRSKIFVICLCAVLSLFMTAAVAPAAEPAAGNGAGAPPPAFTPSNANVVYVPGSSEPMHKLDIYTPLTPKLAGGYPLIIYVHGGGFARGDKYSPGGMISRPR